MEQIENVKRVHKEFATLCGRVLRDTDPQYFPRAQYHGRTIYFCTESCLNVFLSDPDLFYKAHRKSKNDKPPPLE